MRRIRHAQARRLNLRLVMAWLDPAIHRKKHFAEEEGLPGQARQ
jgi:hypothetical protein